MSEWLYRNIDHVYITDLWLLVHVVAGKEYLLQLTCYFNGLRNRSTILGHLVVTLG